jgi:hypothetical protein
MNRAAVWAGAGSANGYGPQEIGRTLGRPGFILNWDYLAAGDPANPGKGYDSSHKQGVQFVFADGAVTFLPDSTSTTDVSRLCNRADRLEPAYQGMYQ